MSIVRSSRPRYLDSIVIFLVLAASFILSCLVLPLDMNPGLILHWLFYATIVVCLVQLSMRWMPDNLAPSTGVARRILANAAGIVVGTGIMLAVESALADGSNMIVALVISGVVAFFVLGTLSPLITRSNSSSVS